MNTINIVTMVDVLGALSKGTLQDYIYMMDNSRDSEGQGTAQLTTVCYPGQPIRWIIYAIDVQTPVMIQSIFFPNVEKKHLLARGFVDPPTAGTEPQWFYWRGSVPSYLPPGRYNYSLRLQMGRGKASILYADTPSLKVL